MKNKHDCQSCGMPINNHKFMGTEIDGSTNPDYCIYCYLNGEFTDPYMTIDEMKTAVRTRLEKMFEDKNTIEQAVNRVPGLKRWKNEVPQL